MADTRRVTGFEALMRELSELDANKTDAVFVLFSGSKDETGRSWCPDCVKADPIIEEAAKSLSDSAVFIRCEVGERPFWKNMSNPFRTDQRLKLTAVPTLIKWNTAKRLVEGQCADKRLIDMLFED